VAEIARFIVSRPDVSLLLAELRDHPQDPIYAPLLAALLTAAQTLDSTAPSQGVSATTTDLGIPAEYADQFRTWLAHRAVRASRMTGDQGKAAVFKRIWQSMR
jgi:hypothetical protein